MSSDKRDNHDNRDTPNVGVNHTEANYDYSKKLASYSTSEFGVPIILHDTAICDVDGDVSIPHHDKLMAAAAVYRCTLPRRLNGKEMKFIRKAMNKSATDWAKHLSTDKSTLSRWESNKQPMSINAEKLLRLTALAFLSTDAPGLDIDSKKISLMEYEGFATPDEFPEMRFILCKFRKDELYTDLGEAA